MTAATLAEPTLESVEARLRDELARGGAALSAAAPILRYLAVNGEPALLNDEIVARVRGMLGHVARQLLHAQAKAGELDDPRAFTAEREQGLARRLADEPALLAHLHALAIEGRITLQLLVRHDADPVLSPLLQDLVASTDDGVAGAAMAALAAQSRFIQHYRRMSLPLGELPGGLLDSALLALRATVGERDVAVAAGRAVREAFDEDRGRLALLASLLGRMDESSPHALDLDRAGLAIFATALATASKQGRDQTVMALGGRQPMRFALALRAAGLDQPTVERQVLALDPDATLPEGFGQVTPDLAESLLVAGGADT
jgi:hypothetical protein